MRTLPKISKADRKSNPEARMSIGDHLREARNRLIVSAIGALIGTIVGFIIFDDLYALLTYPLDTAIRNGTHLSLNYGTVLSSFDLRLRICMWAGVIMSSPLWVYQFWAYMAPGMTKKEKRYAWAYGVASLVLFAMGVALAVLVLPHAVDVLTRFIPANNSTGFMNASMYMSFVMRLVLVFGLAFLVPEVMVGINQLGLIKGTTMLRGWRWAVLAIFIFMAIANPLPDPWSMVFMALPICGLYFMACGIAIRHDKNVEKRRRKREAEINAALAAAEEREEQQRRLKNVAAQAQAATAAPALPATDSAAETASLPATDAAAEAPALPTTDSAAEAPALPATDPAAEAPALPATDPAAEAAALPASGEVETPVALPEGDADANLPAVSATPSTEQSTTATPSQPTDDAPVTEGRDESN